MGYARLPQNVSPMREKRGRMLFYFNCNSTQQANILRECGARNVILTYKFVKPNFDEMCEGFDNILVNPGRGVDADEYYDFLKANKDKIKFNALQYDVQNEPSINFRYYTRGAEKFPIIPILHDDYIQALSIFKPHIKEGSTVALGQMKDKLTETEQLKRLDTRYKYHGLAKGRWVKEKNISSIDSSSWLSGVRGRKTEVFRHQSLYFGEKGRTNSAVIQGACQRNFLHLTKTHLDPKQLLEGEYNALMKSSIALYYMPMFKAYGIYNENFK